MEPCRHILHPLAQEGIDLFNRGEYFAAHEALEAAWKEESDPVRELYRGILQIAVAYYHIQNDNYTGARKMLMRCKPWLEPFLPHCQRIDVEALLLHVDFLERELIRLGPSHLANVEPHLLKSIPRVNTTLEKS